MLPVFQGARGVLKVILTSLICPENDQGLIRVEIEVKKHVDTGKLVEHWRGVQKFSTPLALIYSVHHHVVRAGRGDGEVARVPSAHRLPPLFALQPPVDISVVAGQDEPLCTALCW